MNDIATSFDLIVIGTGTAASTVAYQCRSAGWDVAVIDSRPFGGTCALRGCDPKKVLVSGENVIDWNQRMKGKGITYSNENAVSISWRDLMHFKRSFTEPLPKNREENFTKAGITTFHGRAHFVGPTSIKVKVIDNTNPHYKNDSNYNNQEHILNGKYIVIASGAMPAKLNIPGIENITTSDQFLELDSLPRKIVFVGGGYISFEFANIAAHAGSKASILHRSDRPLGHFDSDLVEKLVRKAQEIGIDVKLQTEVRRMEKTGDKLVVYASSTSTANTGSVNDENKTDSEKKDYSIETDMVVHGAGRVAEIEDLNLQAAGIDRDKKGIKVNEYLQSISNPSVYAAGDAASTEGPQLTPVASHEGQIVASNLLNGNHAKPDYKGVPSVIFTIPPMASVGLLEENAQRQGLRFKTNHMDTSGWYSSKRIGERYSAFKVLIEENTGKILGAHILGPHAEEVINIFAVAIRMGISANQLKQMMFAYPTNSSDITYML